MTEFSGVMKESLIGLLLFVLPKNLLSYWIGKLVHLPLPQPFGKWSVSWFAKRYKINMDEAELPIEQYRSIGRLFIRNLKSGVRPVAEDLIVHPADAEITTFGKIESDELIQAKDKKYLLSEFVGDNSAAEKFKNGYYLTYYLCPTDYHQVHSPVEGKIVKAHYFPGYLWPVNPWSVRNIDCLFAVNERVVVWIETDKGLVALTLVGATNVGKMSLAFDSDIVTNQNPLSPQEKVKAYENPILVKKGDPLGVFHMGSTVIMAYSEGHLEKLPIPGQTRMGEGLYLTH